MCYIVSVGDAVVVSMVLGVPTIKRDCKDSYLARTLQSLIDSLNDEESLECLIVVMICEVRRLSRYFLLSRAFCGC